MVALKRSIQELATLLKVCKLSQIHFLQILSTYRSMTRYRMEKTSKSPIVSVCCKVQGCPELAPYVPRVVERHKSHTKGLFHHLLEIRIENDELVS